MHRSPIKTQKTKLFFFYSEVRFIEWPSNLDKVSHCSTIRQPTKLNKTVAWKIFMKVSKMLGMYDFARVSVSNDEKSQKYEKFRWKDRLRSGAGPKWNHIIVLCLKCHLYSLRGTENTQMLIPGAAFESNIIVLTAPITLRPDK